MKIGITERGDAGIDMSWVSKIDTVDGAILITKNITDAFIQNVLSCKTPLIIHVTCTGYGGSELEPNVPNYKHQIAKAMELIDKGFPAERMVLRIDPIFPTNKGLVKVQQVLYEYGNTLRPRGVDRIRVSILDEYRHVKKRFIDHGWYAIYGNDFQAAGVQILGVARMLASYPCTFETCAEPQLVKFALTEVRCTNIEQVGCISVRDLDRMGINHDGLAMYENPQNRRGCHCLSCKTELLEKRKPCPHGCVYCYWR